MKLETSVMLIHPFVYLWMKKNKLRIIKTYTEFGLIASPEKYGDQKFLFTEKSKYEELARLNKIYGLRLNEAFFDIKSVWPANKTIELISQEAIQAHEMKKVSWQPYIFIGGITIPKKNYFYIEYDSFGGGKVIKSVVGMPIKR